MRRKLYIKDEDNNHPNASLRNNTKNRVSIILLLANFILTVLFPILSIPISVFGMIFSNGKFKKWHGFLLALSLAVVAYIWIPGESMDLYRHHRQLFALNDGNTEQLWVYIRKNLEPAHYLIEYFIAQTGKFDLLQFLVVLCGYAEITWIVCDLSEIKKTKRSTFVLILIYAILGLSFINFASGLWFHLATINTALGVYLRYFRKTKYLHYFFFILAPCLHLGTLYMILAMIFFGKIPLFKKIRLSHLMIIFIGAFMFGTIVSVISNIVGSDSIIAKIMNGKFTEYFINGSQFDYLHTGWNMYIAVSGIVLSLILALYCAKNKRDEIFASFVAYMAVFVLANIMNAGVFIRYGYFMMMMSFPLMANVYQLTEGRRIRLLLTATIITLAGMRGCLSVRQIGNAGLTNQIKANATKSIVEIMEK